MKIGGPTNSMNLLKKSDSKVAAAIEAEAKRQAEYLQLIASENYVSSAVLAAQGSILTNKYSEGYPAKRYYGGCVNMDTIEALGQERAKKLFGSAHANLQPHSGSQANMAAYFSLLSPGDKILAMDFTAGGHLTHGHKMNFSGKMYQFSYYHVDPGTEQLDMAAVRRQAMEIRPKMIVAGSSSYPRAIDFAAFKAIADEIGALLMVDMAHIAGLVAGGVHMNPVPYADVVTSSTHKTLRGPRGGMILARADHAEAIDKMLFPGIQGGPLMHVVAAKTVMLQEALKPSFKVYTRQVVANAKRLADALIRLGHRIVSGGTDNHMLLIDVRPLNTTGKDASAALERAGITVNMNRIPYDPLGPLVTSGLRLGTASATTRGMKEKHMEEVAVWLDGALRHAANPVRVKDIRAKVTAFCKKFPPPA